MNSPVTTVGTSEPKTLRVPPLVLLPIMVNVVAEVRATSSHAVSVAPTDEVAAAEADLFLTNTVMLGFVSVVPLDDRLT